MKLLRFLLLLILWGITAARLEAVTTRYDRTAGLASDIVGGGVMTPDGLMWFATWNGLHCYDGYQFHRVAPTPGDSSSIDTNLIRYLSLDGDGNLLCRTDGGIYLFDRAAMRFSHEPVADDSVSQAMERVWHGTTVTQGTADILWAGSTTGLYKSVTPHHPAVMLPATQGFDSRAITLDSRGRLWVGSRSIPQLVMIADSRVTQTTSPGFTPYSICQLPSGEMYVGGKPAGLQRDESPVDIDFPVYDMIVSPPGRLWLATWGGGVMYIDNPSADNPQVTPIGGKEKVRKLIETSGGNIVAATTSGLLVINPGDMTATRVTRNPADSMSLVSNATMSLARDSSGNIYVATESSGISRVTEESLLSDHPVFHHLNITGSTIGSDEIRGMALENDSTLIVTGVDRVTIINTLRSTAVTYNRPFWGDSIVFAESTPVRLADGTWLFPTQSGVVSASAHSLYTRGYVPPLVITTISINGGDTRLIPQPCNRLDLDSRSRNLTLHFTAPDYVDNSCIRYRYSLDGSPWSPYGEERAVTLFNLSAGTHRLLLQSTDRYGRPVDNTLELEITVAPRWYETLWAMIIFIAVGAAVIAGGVYVLLYIRRVNRQRRELLDKYMALIDRPATAVTLQKRTPAPVVESAEDELFLNRVQSYIEQNISNPEADIDAMASAAAVSRATLNRRLKSLMGISAAKLLTAARLQRAASLWAENPALPLAEVAAACGYSDPYYFSKVYKKSR